MIEHVLRNPNSEVRRVALCLIKAPLRERPDDRPVAELLERLNTARKQRRHPKPTAHRPNQLWVADITFVPTASASAKCSTTCSRTSHPIIDALEARIGKPVVTATQAVLWRLLRLAGVAAPIPGFGRLLREH